MKRNNSIKEIFDKIKSSKRILISLHKGPDGDSLGSCMALKYLLERDFNKKVKIISKDSLSSELKIFDFVKEIEFGKSMDSFSAEKFDILIAPDFGTIEGFSEKGKSNFFTISIDHHDTHTYFGNLNYVNSGRPSCCSVLLDIFKELKIHFDKELSTRLLLGIYTDSGMFAHDNGDALRDAVFLIDRGADYLDGIVNPLKYNISLTSRKYLALVTDKFRIVNFNGFKIGVSVVSKEDIRDLNLELADIRGAPNYLQEIGGVDFLFTLAEREEGIKGSFRSRKKIDVLRFAKELGGGGHKFAASFILEKMPMDKAEKKVFEAIKKVGVVKIDNINL